MGSLKDKLRMISSQSAPVSRSPEEKKADIFERTTSLPLSGKPLSLDAAFLRRIGYTGEVPDIRDCLFVDTETTGLSGGVGTVAFLVGAGYVDGDDFTVKQWMLRDYPDEPGMLRLLSGYIREKTVFVTYNGRTFDLPLLSNRFTMCRMRDKWPHDPRQIDLLYPARACWKERLKSCKLSNVEEKILGIYRTDDIPGSEVPALFFEFLRTGDQSLLDGVLKHNETDIRSLYTLLAKLNTIFAAPEQLEHMGDLYSMGRVLLRRNEPSEGKKLFTAVAFPYGKLTLQRRPSLSARALWQLYRLARLEKNYPEMEKYLLRLKKHPDDAAMAAIELSKLYEHHLKDIPSSLACAREAYAKLCGSEKSAVQLRIDRLIKKLAQKKPAQKEEKRN